MRYPIPRIFTERYNEQANHYNDKGQKEGYWIEDWETARIETYYKNGRKSGYFKYYTKSTPATLLFLVNLLMTKWQALGSYLATMDIFYK